MKRIKEFCESKGLGDNPILYGDKRPYLLSDLLHEFAHNVLDEAAQRAEAVLMGSGDYWADVDPKSILNLKNEL